ncbi:UNVERIFIED_CONTAM: Retrovirus-related Pol polyprotein from transposon.6 [Sesamum radiatum]|uniref:Retrovirus-related Pol polyprotein from transposon.6 n=1 Tax=Sesamum radiatum TaxID=300843 RepID=A0AAW2VYK7_SESRA
MLSHQVAAKKTVPPRASKTAPVLTGSHPEEEAQPRNPWKKGLIFVDVKIHGKSIRAMIITGATHNYLASTELERLGLVLEKGVGLVRPYVIPILVGRTGEKNLLAMQFKKGCKRSEPSYLYALRFDGIEEASGPIPGIVKRLLKEFEDVMPDELLRKLPSKRAVDHKIELVPGTKPPATAPYRMSHSELVELRKQLKEMLESGIIKPAKSLYEASVLFQKKVDGSYDGDEAKRTVVTRYGAFEFLVMPFGLMNAPATFSTLINQVPHGFLDEFVVVYLDDIVIYSGTLAEHVEHLRQVLTRLRKHELYAKVSKCSFAQETISWGTLWERILANYYRRFANGYSEIARPMMDLLKKTETWNWTPQYQVSFDNLKRTMVIDHVLALPDMSKPFMVETDASDFALGSVLMQDGHPVFFESRKLKDVDGAIHNHVADALSRRADLASLVSVAALASSAVATSIRDRARELLPRDSAAQGLVHLVEQGKARQFWLEDGLLMTKGNCLYVPKGGDLRKSLISECHDTLWARH